MNFKFYYFYGIIKTILALNEPGNKKYCVLFFRSWSSFFQSFCLRLEKVSIPSEKVRWLISNPRAKISIEADGQDIFALGFEI